MSPPTVFDVVVLLGHNADEHQGATVADAVRAAVGPAGTMTALRGVYGGSWWPDDELTDEIGRAHV